MVGRANSENLVVRRNLTRDIQKLGVASGDVIFVRAATRAVLPESRGASVLLRDALLDAVGEDGSVVALTFTASQPVWVRERRAVFTVQSPTTVGGFASAVLADSRTRRSRHPLNSISVIGPASAHLIAGHDRRERAFSWIERLIECGGKQLLIGCVDASPGFSTVHYAQEQLGLSSRTLFRGVFGCFVEEEDGSTTWFAPKDCAGCSLGFWRMYGHYVRAGILHASYVGSAYSILASAADAFHLDKEILAANPRELLCGRAGCLRCATNTYNLRALAPMVVTKAAYLIKGRS